MPKKVTKTAGTCRVLGFVFLLLCPWSIHEAQSYLRTPPATASWWSPGNPNFYLKRHRYQEAAWEFFKRGDSTSALQALSELDKVLHGSYRSVEPLGSKLNASQTYLVTFQHGVKGVFKVEGSDSIGVVQREVAVYRLDCVLGINLTPMTIMREVSIPGAGILHGSLMYFIRDAKSSLAAKAGKPDRLRFFDAVIGNIDRHENNWLIMKSGGIAAIDHDRTFLYDRKGWAHTRWRDEVQRISKPSKLGQVYAIYKNLSTERLASEIADFIGQERFELFLSAREEIIEMLESRRQNRGP